MQTRTQKGDRATGLFGWNLVDRSGRTREELIAFLCTPRSAPNEHLDAHVQSTRRWLALTKLDLRDARSLVESRATNAAADVLIRATRLLLVTSRQWQLLSPAVGEFEQSTRAVVLADTRRLGGSTITLWRRLAQRRAIVSTRDEAVVEAYRDWRKALLRWSTIVGIRLTSVEQRPL